MKDGFNAALADERRKINIRQADLERRENQLKTKLQDAQRYFEASGLDAMILEFRRLARLGKAVSQLEELAAGNLHGEVCEGGDSGASQYRISSTRSAGTPSICFTIRRGRVPTVRALVSSRISP